MTNIIISGTGTDDYVELSSNTELSAKAQGRLFRKQILHIGSFAHPKVPGKRIVVDSDFAKKLVENFNNKVCDIVQVPIVDDDNRHVENPEKNIGRVVDLSYDATGVYATIDALKHADDLGKTLIGASAMMSMDYKDTDTGEYKGPTLLHVAVTNRPYVTKLGEFESISLSNDEDSETLLVDAANTVDEIATNDKVADTVNEETVLLGAASNENPNEETVPMTKDELIAALKEQGIDVLALQKTAEQTAELSNIIDTGDIDALKDVTTAVVELSHAKDELELKLSNQIKVAETQNALIEELVNESKALKLSVAEGEIDQLIKAGRVLPKQREAMLKLSVNDHETFEALLPEEPIVSLSENGVTTHQDTRSDKLQADLERYTRMARGESAE